MSKAIIIGVAGDRGIEVIDFFADQKLELVEPADAGVDTSFFLAVEDFLAVDVDFKASAPGGGQLDGDIPGILRPPELCRQPRGDRVVASRNAIKDFNFYFSELGCGHVAPELPACTTSHRATERFLRLSVPLCLCDKLDKVKG